MRKRNTSSRHNNIATESVSVSEDSEHKIKTAGKYQSRGILEPIIHAFIVVLNQTPLPSNICVFIFMYCVKTPPAASAANKEMNRTITVINIDIFIY